MKPKRNVVYLGHTKSVRVYTTTYQLVQAEAQRTGRHVLGMLEHMVRTYFEAERERVRR